MIRMQDLTHGFAVPGDWSTIDVINPNNGRGVYSDETLDQVRLRYPGAEIVNLDEMAERRDASFKRGVSESSKAKFWEMLEILPPVGWRNDGQEESFKMVERTCGDVTNIYARFGDRYFHLADSIYLKHAEIMSRVRAFILAKPATTED